MRQVSGSGEIGGVHYTRTTASIRRHANQENEKYDTKPRRQTKLFNVGVLIFLVPLSECVSKFSMHISVYDRIHARVTGLYARPLCSDIIWSQHRSVAVLRYMCEVVQVMLRSIIDGENVAIWLFKMLKLHTHTHTHTRVELPLLHRQRSA